MRRRVFEVLILNYNEKPIKELIKCLNKYGYDIICVVVIMDT